MESEKEVKISKAYRHKPIVLTPVEIQDDFDLMLQKFDLCKAFRISFSIL